MREPDDWVRDLKPLATTSMPAPPWDPPRPRRWIAAVVMAAALLAVFLISRERPGLRGVEGAPSVDLRVAVERGGLAVRIAGPCEVGERVYFRLSASEAADVAVWVDGPGGRQRVGGASVGVAPADLAGPGGLLAYEFDAPGVYRFSTRVDGPCDCGAVDVEVR